jgi:5-deoxy-glucuronate isomerase
MSEWFLPARSTADDEYDLRVTPGERGWSHTGLLVATLSAGESRTIETGEREYIVLPLSGGGVSVDTPGERFDLVGRSDVFAGPSDLVYVPRKSTLTVTSNEGGRVALPHALARESLPACRVEATEVPVELRGAGSCSRQVHNFGTPGTLEADSLIACEVITPAGNWSSYPPHKHDEERDGIETALEEIYYFQLRAESGAPPVAAPFGYQRVYGADDRPIDVLAEVRTDDVVLVPHGWHGPAMAPAGYDMYYLNVMAGPGPVRAWLICDDPSHAWVRGTWADQPVDARLPFGSGPS